MREEDGPVGVENEGNERDLLIGGTIMGLERNLVLKEIRGIHKNDPS